MEIEQAISALGALAHPKRLEAFRFLVAAGEEGAASGQLASALDMLPSTMSVNLNRLAAAGLVRSTREGKVVRYFADLAGAERLLRFLMQDCCGGRPEVCGPWLTELSAAARTTEAGARPETERR